MLFTCGSRVYASATAREIVAALERDDADYPFKGGPLRRFVSWSLSRLGDCVPQRELDANARINDEALALSYLCLCDEYGVGVLVHEDDER
jgi:hypothetical protein